MNLTNSFLNIFLFLSFFFSFKLIAILLIDKKEIRIYWTTNDGSDIFIWPFSNGHQNQVTVSVKMIS